MKKIIAILLGITLMFSMTLTGCGSSGDSASKESTTAQKNITIKKSPDKYTFYIKNYVGKNLANVGYYSMGGDLRDTYGDESLLVIPVAEDGSYINIEKEETLQNYVVTGQNLAPNTELKLVFEKDENGEEEEDGFVQYANYDDIVLTVKKLSGANKYDTVDVSLTEIKASPDANTRYCKDYVGRNLRFAGYYSLGGEFLDAYGAGTVKLNIVTDDGSFVDPEKENQLRQYYVVSQSIEPNTEITFDYNEEWGYADSQSISEIELNVKKLPEK